MIDDLTPTTHYTVDVAAVTRVGAGPRMEASFESGVTPTLPDKPLSLALTDVGPRSVNLQFTPGFNGHSYIKRWIVEGRIGSSSIFTTLYNIRYTNDRKRTVFIIQPHSVPPKRSRSSWRAFVHTPATNSGSSPRTSVGGEPLRTPLANLRPPRPSPSARLTMSMQSQCPRTRSASAGLLSCTLTGMESRWAMWCSTGLVVGVVMSG